tara:strand:+ start:1974 stop:2162 length:189 start_codon:yes stop_codon:yes gene_type:complete
MQVGDLVKRKPEWGEWVKHNPWMYTEKDLEIGMVVQTETDLIKVLWPSFGTGWISKDALEAL